MSNKNIRDAFDAFTPNMEQKERVRSALANREIHQKNERVPIHGRKPLIAACAMILVVALGLGLFPMLVPNEHGGTDIALAGLTITAYAMGNNEPVPVMLEEGKQVKMALMRVPEGSKIMAYAFTLDLLEKFSFIRLQAKTNERNEAAWIVPEGNEEVAYLIGDSEEPSLRSNTIYWNPDNSVTELTITAYDDKREVRAVITLQVKQDQEDAFTVELAEIKSYPVHAGN
ncbi:MAG: hypothetical protein ACYDG2_07385 [Ruminiclostridium sp.]